MGNVGLRIFRTDFAWRAYFLAALFILLGSVYLLWIRPGQMRWGATDEELLQTLPNDSIVEHPNLDATRAITIQGRPEAVWPWLAQMGYRQAGYYGYDLIENIGSPRGLASATTILREFQNPRPGGVVPISAVASVIYGPVAAGRYVTWHDAADPPHGVFVWALEPVGATHTRLISRIRLQFHKPGFPLLLDLFTEFGDSIAVRRILEGVRDRAEGRPPVSLWVQAVLLAGWVLALLELVVSTTAVLVARRWGRAWGFALAAGLMLQVVLYAGAPDWLNAVLPWLYLALAAWVVRGRARLLRPSGDGFPAPAK